MRRLLTAALLLAACGDNDTNDNRGYTKAPLENPTVLVQTEHASVMDRLGDPIYPQAPIIKPEEEQPAEQPGAAEAPAGAVPPGATTEDVTAGSQIFSSTGNCFTCHGQNGTGTGLAPALNDSEWLNIDGEFASIERIIATGVAQPKQFAAPMPAKGGAPLTDEQVRQVAAYVYSLSH